MTNLGLNGLLLALVLAFHFPCHRRKSYNVLLTRDDSLILKGYFSLVIICHHLAQRIDPGSLFRMAFNDAGYIAVAVYFFITGYGIMKSYLTKPDYSCHFLKNHVKSVLLPALIAIVFHWLAYAVQRDGYTVSAFFGQFFINTRSTSFLWYVFIIGFFYPSIARTMKKADGDGKKLLFGALKYVLVIFAIGLILIPFAFWVYDTTHLLALGMAAAYYEKDWMRFLSKHTWIKLLGAIALAIVCFAAALAIINPLFNYIAGMNFYRSIDSVLFVVVILLFFSKACLTNQVMKEMGVISYEIYLLHGIVLMFLRGPLIYISNDCIWALLTILITIPFAFLYHSMIKRIRS